MTRSISLMRVKSIIDENFYKAGKLWSSEDFLVSAVELAEVLQISDRHVRRLDFPKQGNKYFFWGGLKFYIDYFKKKIKEGSEAKEQYLKAKAAQEEIKCKKLQGLVVDVEDVKSQAMQAMQILKEALFALPSVLSPKLEKKEKEEIYTILNDAVKKITNTIADKIQEQINANESNISANTPTRGNDEDI